MHTWLVPVVGAAHSLVQDAEAPATCQAVIVPHWVPQHVHLQTLVGSQLLITGTQR